MKSKYEVKYDSFIYQYSFKSLQCVWKSPVEIPPPGDFPAIFEVPHDIFLINASVSFLYYLYVFGFWFKGKDH